MNLHLGDFINKSNRQLVIKKDDVMIVLEAINKINNESRFNKILDLKIGNCGYTDELADRWFIHFDTSDRKWKLLIAELKNCDRKIQIEFDGKFHLI